MLARASAPSEMHSGSPQLEDRVEALHARIQRLRRWVVLLVVASLVVAVPATFLWGKGGYAMFGGPERASPTVVLLGLGAGVCVILAAILALRIVRLADSLPRGR